MPHVYSTATNDCSYSHYEQGGADLPRRVKTVTVKGGRGWTPTRGKAFFPGITEVSDEDAEFLMNNEAFLRHEKAGFVRIEDSKVEAEKVVADMETQDGSAPLVPEDFKAEDRDDGTFSTGEPTTGKTGKKRAA